MNAGSASHGRQHGFTLIELMIAVAIVAILATIALPGYREYVTRGSREAVKAQLIDLASTQEKIFLNSNAYAGSVTNAYTGASTGGLGATTGRSLDNRYTLSVAVDGASFTLTATPVAGSTQASDGNLSINSQGQRTWGTKTW